MSERKYGPVAGDLLGVEDLLSFSVLLGLRIISLLLLLRFLMTNTARTIARSRMAPPAAAAAMITADELELSSSEGGGGFKSPGDDEGGAGGEG